jgi:hypothetical protein
MMTFKEWQEQAVSIETRDMPQAIRDSYIFPNGVYVMEDFVTPRNPFKKSFSLVVVSYTIPMDTKVDHAEVSDDYYTEDGFGVPVFRGDDAMENAFNYAMSLSIPQGV